MKPGPWPAGFDIIYCGEQRYSRGTPIRPHVRRCHPLGVLAEVVRPPALPRLLLGRAPRGLHEVAAQ